MRAAEPPPLRRTTTTSAISVADIEKGCDVLQRVLRQILEHPLEERFRRVKVSGGAWATATAVFEQPSSVAEWLTEVIPNTQEVGLEAGSSGDRVLVIGGPVPSASGPLLDRMSAVKDVMLAVEFAHAAIGRVRRDACSLTLLIDPTHGDDPKPSKWLEAALSRHLVGAAESEKQASLRWLALALDDRMRALVTATGEEQEASDSDVTSCSSATTTTSAVLKGLLAQFPSMTSDDLESCRSVVTQALEASLAEEGRAAAEARTRRRDREALAAAERQAPRLVQQHSLPPELVRSATSLIVDIGGLMEMCSVLEHRHSSDRRLHLMRRDRIVMKELMDQFISDGDIVRLHHLKEQWLATLQHTKRQFGVETVFLEEGS